MPAESSTTTIPAWATPACAVRPLLCAASRPPSTSRMTGSWRGPSVWTSCSTPSSSPRAASRSSTAAMRSARKMTIPIMRTGSNGMTAATCTAATSTGTRPRRGTTRRPARAGSSRPSARSRPSAPSTRSLTTRPTPGSWSPTMTTSWASGATTRARSSSPCSTSATTMRSPGSTRRKTIST